MTKGARKPSPAKKHARIENLSIFGASTRMGPLVLHMYSSDFLSVAKAAAPPAVQFAPARTYLACRALELVLKAFLSLKGYPLEKLAGGPFAHDLDKLLTEALKQGLSDLLTLEDRQIAEIRLASKYYSEKVFEYPALYEAVSGYPHNPDINLLLDAATTMVVVLEKPCLEAE